MSNWVLAGARFNFLPTPENHLYFRHLHFQFCKNSNEVITADLYLNTLLPELKNDILKLKSANRKSLTLMAFEEWIQHPVKRRILIKYLDQPNTSRKETLIILKDISGIDKPIMQAVGTETIESKFVSDETVNNIVKNPPAPNQVNKNEALLKSTKDLNTPKINTRTYIIASQIYFEVINKSSEFPTLKANLQELKDFIRKQFNVSNLSDRISDSEIRYYDYAKILSAKNNDSERGQLKPQLKQVSDNPQVFGEEISSFAADLIKKMQG